MITKKQELLRYIDSHVPRYSTKKLIIKDLNGNSYNITLPKLDLISKIIRNFNDDCEGKLYDDNPVIKVSEYEIV